MNSKSIKWMNLWRVTRKSGRKDKLGRSGICKILVVKGALCPDSHQVPFSQKLTLWKDKIVRWGQCMDSFIYANTCTTRLWCISVVIHGMLCYQMTEITWIRIIIFKRTIKIRFIFLGKIKNLCNARNLHGL